MFDGPFQKFINASSAVITNGGVWRNFWSFLKKSVKKWKSTSNKGQQIPKANLIRIQFPDSRTRRCLQTSGLFDPTEAEKVLSVARIEKFFESWTWASTVNFKILHRRRNKVATKLEIIVCKVCASGSKMEKNLRVVSEKNQIQKNLSTLCRWFWFCWELLPNMYSIIEWSDSQAAIFVCRSPEDIASEHKRGRNWSVGVSKNWLNRNCKHEWYSSLPKTMVGFISMNGTSYCRWLAVSQLIHNSASCLWSWSINPWFNWNADKNFF